MHLHPQQTNIVRAQGHARVQAWLVRTEGKQASRRDTGEASAHLSVLLVVVHDQVFDGQVLFGSRSAHLGRLDRLLETLQATRKKVSQKIRLCRLCFQVSKSHLADFDGHLVPEDHFAPRSWCQGPSMAPEWMPGQRDLYSGDLQTEDDQQRRCHGNQNPVAQQVESVEGGGYLRNYSR